MIQIREAVKTFPGRKVHGQATQTWALQGVSVDVQSGEVLGLIGESGSGKSTLARCVTKLENLTSGTITYRGECVSSLKQNEFRRFRRDIQMVFQDPTGSLNPRQRVLAAVEEPLRYLTDLGTDERRKRARQVLAELGLSADFDKRYRRQMSGGQRQLVSIARALVVDPSVVVLDEPVSSLDADAQGRVLNLLVKEQQRREMTFLFITHDLEIARRLCDRVAIMHRGAVVELGPTEDVFRRPQHVYTQLLLSSILSKQGLQRDARTIARHNAAEYRRALLDQVRALPTLRTDTSLTDLGNGHAVLCEREDRGPLGPA